MGGYDMAIKVGSRVEIIGGYYLDHLSSNFGTVEEIEDDWYMVSIDYERLTIAFELRDIKLVHNKLFRDVLEELITKKYIKELREDLGLTQKELANMLNVYLGTVKKWESGKALPNITNKRKIYDFSLNYRWRI